MDIKNNDIKNNGFPKNKGGRPPKYIKYIEEKKQILQQLFDILGITEENKIFYWDDIDEEKKKKIMDLLANVQKYFNCGHWTVITRNLDIPHASLIRYILKDMKIKCSCVYIMHENSKNIKKSGLQLSS